jgi:hypothetical protein
MSTTVDALYVQALRNMESVLHALERRVGPPDFVDVGDGYAFRYREKSAYQAIVQKLARLVSGLYAARLLLHSGFIQEQGALHRMVDEFQEDATFLSYGIIANDLTPLHKRYLDAFYMEEFDVAGKPLESSQNRPMIGRDKIHAYLARIENATADPYTLQRAVCSVTKTFSGYVHGASPHIMEMYGGDPPQFHVRGLKHSPLYEDHEYDLWNYFYRGMCAFGFAAKAFGDEALFAQIHQYTKDFAKASGRDVGLPT